MAEAFKDPFTTSRGSAYFVSVEPSFVEQVSEVANALSKSQPEQSRQSFIADVVEQAQKAAPSAPEPVENEEDDQDESTAAQEAPEPNRQLQVELLSSLLNQLPQKVDLTDAEFVGLVNLLISLAVSFDLQDSITSKLVPFVAAENEQANPSLSARYIALSNILNATPEVSGKVSTLEALVNFAAVNDDAAVLSPLLRQLPDLLRQWDMAVSCKNERQGNELVVALASKLEPKLPRDEFAASLTNYLRVPTNDSSAIPLYRKLISANLSSPSSVRLPALPESANDLAFELLSIVNRGQLAEYQKFVSANESFVSNELKLDDAQRAAIEKRIRLAGLADVCSKRVGTSVSYDEIRQALQLPESSEEAGGDGDELVESWVIDAIRSTLLSGRLSQPTRSFQITRATTSSFDESHWKQLESRLEGWKTALDQIKASTDAATSAMASRPAPSSSTKQQQAPKENGITVE